MKRPNPGELNHRVTIQRLTLTPDAQGGSTGTWQDVKDVWAKIEPLSSHEVLYAQMQQGNITHRIWMRYQGDLRTYGAALDDISRGLRITDGTRMFTINSFIPHDPPLGMDEILATEQREQQ